MGNVRVWGLGFRVQGSGFRVQGSGFRVQGSGFGCRGVLYLEASSAPEPSVAAALPIAA